MNEKLRKIVNYYGIDKQLKYLQSEVFELNEAIIKKRNPGVLENIAEGVASVIFPICNMEYEDCSRVHIKEEIADVMVMLKQFQLYYNIPSKEIKEVMKTKIDRQIVRIGKEAKKND